MPNNANGTMVVAGEARIPALGCGTWQLRGEPCAMIVAEALRVGFQHIDTAQGYGNEAAVGEGISASKVPRNTIFVTTKVMPHLLSDGPLQRSVEESLARLRVDRIDLLLLHWPNPAIPLAAFGAIIGTIGGIAAAQQRRDYYEHYYDGPYQGGYGYQGPYEPPAPAYQDYGYHRGYYGHPGYRGGAAAPAPGGAPPPSGDRVPP